MYSSGVEVGVVALVVSGVVVVDGSPSPASLGGLAKLVMSSPPPIGSFVEVVGGGVHVVCVKQLISSGQSELFPLGHGVLQDVLASSKVVPHMKLSVLSQVV
jgi:hypothetical protein